MHATTPLPGERYYYRFETVEDESSELETVDAEPPATMDNYLKTPEEDSRFWHRQFGEVVTSKQRKFDWIMGVFMPMVCFFFDPIVFSDSGLLETYKIPAYLLAYSAIMATAASLLFGNRLKSAGMAVGMILSVAAIVSAFIGVILFPLSVIGLFWWLIGLLGFTPFFSAIVFWRNAVRAIRTGSRV
jgi:hypothetical protein